MAMDDRGESRGLRWDQGIKTAAVEEASPNKKTAAKHRCTEAAAPHRSPNV